jgi:hypothetical protein
MNGGGEIRSFASVATADRTLASQAPFARPWMRLLSGAIDPTGLRLFGGQVSGADWSGVLEDLSPGPPCPPGGPSIDRAASAVVASAP